MHYVLRVIRACCAPSGSLPQDRQKSTSRKRKARDSCWGKMHLSAWLKAIINCHGVWNVEEWSLWRNWIVYLFTVLFLIFCANEQNEAFFTRITHDLIYFFFSFFFRSLVCSGVSWDVHEVFFYSKGHRFMCQFIRYRHFVMAVHVQSRHTRWHQANMQKGLMYQQCEAVWVHVRWLESDDVAKCIFQNKKCKESCLG